MATTTATATKFLSYAGLQELIDNKLGIKLGGELSVNGADIILKSKKLNLSTLTIPLAGTKANDGETKLPGLFTNDEKEKLLNIAAGAEVNQNAFSFVTINKNGTSGLRHTLTASQQRDSIRFTPGTNIRITGDDSTKTITIDNTYEYTHPDYSPVALKNPNADPSFGGNFKALGTLTSDAMGHITAASFTDITIPELPTPTATINTATDPTTNHVAVLSTISSASGGTVISHTFDSVNVPTKKYVDDQIANVVASSQAIVLKGYVAQLNPTTKLSKGDAYVCTSTTKIGNTNLEVGDVMIWNGADDEFFDPNSGRWIYLQKNVDIASKDILGLIKVAAKRDNGEINSTTGSTTADRYYGVELDSNNKAFVNVPWTDTTYTGEKGITIDSTTNKIGHTNTVNNLNTKTETDDVTASGDTFTVEQYLYDEHGHITESYDKTITVNNGYVLPVADHDTLGGLKPSKSYSTEATLTTAAATSNSSVTVNDITTTVNRYYAIEADKNGVPFVNVPWTDNAGVTSVTITQGEGITVSGSGIAITETGTRTITLNAATTETLGGIKVSAARVSGADIDENRFGVKTTATDIAYVEIPEITTDEINALFATTAN